VALARSKPPDCTDVVATLDHTEYTLAATSGALSITCSRQKSSSVEARPRLPRSQKRTRSGCRDWRKANTVVNMSPRSIASTILTAALWLIVAGDPAAAMHPIVANRDDLIFVTQWNRDSSNGGCNAPSVYALGAKDALLRAPAIIPPDVVGALAATTDFRSVLALAGNIQTDSGKYFPHLVHLVGAADDPARWSVGLPITGARFHPGKAIAIMPDDESLLVGEYGGPTGEMADSGIAKYCLSEIAPNGRLGPRRGFFADNFADSQIFPSADGRHAHVLGPLNGRSPTGVRFPYGLSTIDVGTMQAIVAPIDMNAHNGQEMFDGSMDIFEASMSPDERYIVTRRPVGQYGEELNVLDLGNRTAWTLPLTGLCTDPYGDDGCGEVAFSYGPENLGLLAVRGIHSIVIFQFVPHGPLRMLSRLPLNPTRISADGYPYSPVAWSGDGSRLVVGDTNQTNSDALILRVDDSGRAITPERWLTGCMSPTPDTNQAVAILTENRHLQHVPNPAPCVPPEATPTPSTTPTRPPPSASVTLTPTSTASPTVNYTPEPTLPPTPIFLPIVLRTEPCTPDTRSADVALVLDTSSSMNETTRPGGPTKFQAAQAAARLFLGELKSSRDQASLIQFNREATVVVPLTPNILAVTTGVGQLVQAPGTRIDLALVVAMEQLTGTLHRPENNPVIVLLTDGTPTGATPEDVRAAASRAKDGGIQVFTIGLGLDVDATLLRDVASRPEWYYPAADTNDLEAIYGKIVVEIPCKPVWP
jgi:uncharacterized protein YegL